jgi:pilus assembly protein FimV
VIGFNPPTLLPGAAATPLPVEAAPLPVDAAPPAQAAAAAPMTPAPAVTTPVAATPPAAAAVPFEGPYTNTPEPTGTTGGKVADPFAIFLRGKRPTPQPIPSPQP